MRTRGIVGAVVAVACCVVAALAMAGGLSQSKKTVAIAFNEQKSVVSKCPGTKHAAWGGFEGTVDSHLQSTKGRVYTVGLVPEGPDVDRFVVDADNGSPPGDFDSKVTSYTYCFKGSKPVVVEASTNVADEDNGGVAATCGEGKVVLGGGFEVDFVNTQGPHMTIEYLGKGSGESYQAEITNVSGDGLNLTAYAVCAKGKKAKDYPGDSVELKKGKPTKAKALCPNSKDLAFGGVSGEYDFVDGIAMPTALYEKGNGVEAVAIGNIGSKMNFRATAYCN